MTSSNLSLPHRRSPEYLIGIKRKELPQFPLYLLMIDKKKSDRTQITTDCAYCDQAHFAISLCSFASIHPSDYANHQGEYVNYIPIK
jgi:hypothetical protein